MKFIFSAALMVVTFMALAQKSPAKFGEIPLEDLRMTTYSKDSSAHAVALFDYGNAYIDVINGDIKLYFERHARIKILGKEGLAWANVSIPLFHNGSTEERVLSLKASSFNLENGQVIETKLSKEGIFKEKVDKYFNQQKFTLPNVKEGTVIEYSYKISSEFFTNFPNWEFQKSIPVRWSEYWAMIPNIFIYERYMQGYVPVSTYTTKKDLYHGTEVTAHHWITENVPAFKEEPYMTTEDDYISRMNFALSHINYSTHTQEIMGSWLKFNNDLLESPDFGKVITGSAYLKDQVESLTAGMADPLQKISTIVNYIKQNVEWDGEKDKYPDNFKKVLEKKKGTAADINMLMIAMLNKAGLDAEPVLLSTRDHGFIRQSYPMARQFNYVIGIVRFADKSLLLDATEKYLPYNTLPSRCLNGQGLVISKTNHGWIDIASKAKSKTTTSLDLVLADDGSLKGKIQFMRDGYDAHEMREELLTKGEAEYVKKNTANKPWQIEKTEFQDVKDMEKPAKEIHAVQIDDHVTVAGDVMYINPYVLPQVDDNPFKQEKRTYPIDYGTARENVFVVKFTIPDGYVVEELPKSKLLGLPGNAGRFMFNANVIGNSISITSNFQVSKTLFNQDEYPVLKEFYNQVIAKQSEQIVIKKK